MVSLSPDPLPLTPLPGTLLMGLYVAILPLGSGGAPTRWTVASTASEPRIAALIPSRCQPQNHGTVRLPVRYRRSATESRYVTGRSGRPTESALMRHSEHLLVSQPPAAVWAFMTNVDNWPQWFGNDRLEQRKTSEGSIGLGTTVSVRFNRPNVQVKIVEFDVLNRIAFQLNIGPFLWKESFGLKPSRDATEVTHTIDVRLRNTILRLLASAFNPFGGLLMGRQIRVELMSLQRALESP